MCSYALYTIPKLLIRFSTKELMQILIELDIDGKDLRLIRNLYWDRKAAIRIGDEMRNYINIKRGVRQGCVLSPDLLSLYSEKILREIKDLNGIKINGININNIRYAKCDLKSKGADIKQVENFVCLGSTLAADGRSDTEVKKV